MTTRNDRASDGPYQRFDPLEQFASEHAALVARTAAAFGLTGVALSAGVLLIPQAIAVPDLFLVLTCHALLAASIVWLWRRGGMLSRASVYGSGLLSLTMTASAAPSTGINFSIAASLAMTAGWCVGSLAVHLVPARGPDLSLLAAFVSLVAAIYAVTTRLGIEPARVVEVLIMVSLLWGLCIIFGMWLANSRTRVSARLTSIGHAHHTERRASETEARRLREARLLHDTALATLTLLAHSGVGVDPEGLRSQADSDRLLLSRLRRGENPRPRTSGEYTLTNTAELELGGTLEAVKSRFRATDLTVTWHGSGQLGLGPERLDAFMGAVVECIENVRRHAQVTAADVTLGDDGSTVRAVVTDTGVGFDPSGIPGGHLGFRQSVVARVEEHHGSVRVFSAPGLGTTVVLEMPK